MSFVSRVSFLIAPQRVHGMPTYQSCPHYVQQAWGHHDARALVEPVAFDVGFDFAFGVAHFVLPLVDPWLAVALGFCGHDELQARGDGAEPLVEFLAVVDDPVGGWVVAVHVENGIVIACAFKELR